MRTILALAFLLGDLTNSDEKDLDEEKAYEFGFTIEGMQHRLEKKDVNGIIQGEFGFITADGVYHVTVYATDENGSFRIISMRNIKISPPLDGSPDFSLKAYSSTSKGPQAQLENFRTRPLASSQPVRYQEKIQTSSTKRLNRPFTTQPTLKPSCAGCGYIATSKKPPIRSPTLGSEVVVSFSSENFKAIRENGSIPSNYSGQISEPPTASLKSGDFEKTLLIRLFSSNQLPTKGILPTNITSERELPSNSSYIHPKNIQATPQRYDMERSQAPQKVENNFSDFKNERTLSTYSRNISSQSNSFSNLRNEQNELQRRQKHPQYFSKTSKNLAPLKVSKDLIKIPGNPDIPIRDKYRGMTDGLPPGIDVTDITQILYRFNWTVGFQGHYETGYKNGSKVGGYFVNGSDGISRIVTYVADEFGYRPIVRIVNIGIDSSVTPKDDKTFELKSFEFVWYPLK